MTRDDWSCALCSTLKTTPQEPSSSKSLLRSSASIVAGQVLPWEQAPPICSSHKKMAARVVRRLGLLVARRGRGYGKRDYSDSGPSRGPDYTTDLAEATVSLTSKRPLPVYRVLGAGGEVLDTSQDPGLPEETMVRMYEKMTGLCQVDQDLYKAQRMGLISFYMMSLGEEATQFGSAAALHERDMVYGQYREPGVLLWRGFSLDQMVDQCFNNRHDPAHGRQMPVHYGSPEHHFQFISSPLATQMPQAPGYAYGLKQAGSDNCVIVYFGDGAAQEGDAHAAMNFAATLECPVIFFCRNNGYAISTPVEENYRGDGLALRALGYGMEGYRVDGNDALAVYNVTKKAREVAVGEGVPVLIEAMTYRLGSHSTSDDQSGYQDMDEVKNWLERYFPRDRLRGYLQSRGLWDEEKEAALISATNLTIKNAIKRARAEKKPSLGHMFTDVYSEPPPRLRRQEKEMQAIVAKYPEHFPTASHE